MRAKISVQEVQQRKALMRKLITFATPEFRESAQLLRDSAVRFFDQISIYGPQDIPHDFRKAHPQHFNIRRGYALWTFKPLLILREIERMTNEDVLFYSDAQVIFEADPSEFIDAARRNNGIGIVHQKREKHKNSTWTRGDCFKVMACDEPKYWDGDNLATTFSAWTKTESLARVRS